MVGSGTKVKCLVRMMMKMSLMRGYQVMRGIVLIVRGTLKRNTCNIKGEVNSMGGAKTRPMMGPTMWTIMRICLRSSMMNWGMC